MVQRGEPSEGRSSGLEWVWSKGLPVVGLQLCSVGGCGERCMLSLLGTIVFPALGARAVTFHGEKRQVSRSDIDRVWGVCLILYVAGSSSHGA